MGRFENGMGRTSFYGLIEGIDSGGAVVARDSFDDS